MKIINNQNLLRVILYASFIVVSLLVLVSISSILEFLNNGADRSSILHLEKESTNTYQPKVKWLAINNPARPIENTTLKNVENDYLLAWFVKNQALKTNTNKGIDDYYTQNARKNINDIIDYNKKNKISVETTTLKHYPKLNFYSEDGQQLVFTDYNVIEFQKIFLNDKHISSIQDTCSYRVLMLLEDGFWRIRHLEKLEKVKLPDSTITPKKIFTVKDKTILKNNIPTAIKGINYYPKNSAWDTFGANFNVDTIAKDFDIIKNAKLNTIRIFVQYNDFGEGIVSKEKLQKLHQILDLAQAKELNVIITLFDFYGDYSLNSWTLTHRHAESIVTSLKNHPAILAWDVKNEPNLDFKSRGKSNVTDWLKQTINVIKENDPNHLVTIGWSDTESGVILKDHVDFVSYHYYLDIDSFESVHQKLNVSTSKPIVLQEFGITSYGGIWNFFKSSAEKQKAYHQKMQSYFTKNKIAFVSWTLYDFPEVPNAVVGNKPWHKKPQKEFGFIDIKGKKKLAYAHISH